MTFLLCAALVLAAVAVALAGYPDAGVIAVCVYGVFVFGYKLTAPDHYVNGGSRDDGAP